MKVNKINQLLQNHPKGAVFLSSQMEKMGISSDLQKKYRAGGWLESIGRGAMKRTNESVHWTGGVYSLQQSADDIHVGGISAMDFQGSAHFLAQGDRVITLFSSTLNQLPAWFRDYNWATSIRLIHTGFLPDQVGMTSIREGEMELIISNRVRALMECLYLVPDKFDFMEAVYLMDGLPDLSPELVEELLSTCKSVKVNRLFLFLAQLSGHSWLKYISQDKVNIGRGKRQIVKGGVLDTRFGITVPLELADRL